MSEVVLQDTLTEANLSEEAAAMVKRLQESPVGIDIIRLVAASNDHRERLDALEAQVSELKDRVVAQQ